jgi:hypothetical protein
MDKPLLFIHNTRTAGWGLITYLSPVPFFYTVNHLAIKDVPNREDYITFTTVRDPFTRVHSQFEFYQKRRKKLPDTLSFEDFVLNYDYWASQHNLKKSLHTCFDYISVDNKIVVDHILHFENLDQEYNQLAQQYNLPLNLPHEHKNEYKGEYTPSLYTQEMRDKIHQLFNKDFNL